MSNSNFIHTVKTITSNTRFSDYVIEHFPVLPSKKSIKNAIKSGCFTLNGLTATTGMWVQNGDVIKYNPTEKSEPKKYELKLDVIYEDDDLAVINKPAGIPVNGHYFKTVENALPFNLKETASENQYFKPRPVHRLDSQTSGLLIISKTHKAHMNLSKQFETGEVKKEYSAVVQGLVEESGMIDSPIESREAKSIYNPVRSTNSIKNGHLTLLRLKLLTGRTHQLRIHLAEIGHPIVGDKLHGEEDNTFTGKGLFLASVKIQFKHPSSGNDMKFEIDIPGKFESLLSREDRRWRRLKQNRP